MIRDEQQDADQHRRKHERFMALLAPCHEQLSRFTHALTQDVEDGRDLLSDTILRAYDGLDALKSDHGFVSFIFTIARRSFYRELRRRKWWGVFDRQVAERIPDHNSFSSETRLDTSLLNEALNKLPIKQREAVILFEISGLSLEEVREIQGGSISGVKSRIVRGRARLGNLLREKPIQEGAASQRSKSATTSPRLQLTLLREESL
jgi:RNA polymerase sigma-70 factor, ECF subfamily